MVMFLNKSVFSDQGTAGTGGVIGAAGDKGERVFCLLTLYKQWRILNM